MSAGVGLVFASVDGPVQGRVYGVFDLVADVEQASDLGEGQASASAGWRRGERAGAVGGYLADAPAGSGAGVGGCGSPFLLRCRLARGFHVGPVGCVERLKGAPEQQGCGLSRAMSVRVQEHLPGEQA
jgi:hypothetical protein